ncbi:4588_t:CDS:1, partial [Gigaspora margarita]
FPPVKSPLYPEVCNEINANLPQKLLSIPITIFAPKTNHLMVEKFNNLINKEIDQFAKTDYLVEKEEKDSSEVAIPNNNDSDDYTTIF